MRSLLYQRKTSKSLPLWGGAPRSELKTTDCQWQSHLNIQVAVRRADGRGIMEHNYKLTPRAQELRKNMTKEERRLWYEYLHSYPLRFRRQVTFGNYILDFYCAAAKLAIELDGSQHYDPDDQRYDQERTTYLNSIGIEVLRFSNLDVQRNLIGVCQAIDMAVTRRIS